MTRVKFLEFMQVSEMIDLQIILIIEAILLGGIGTRGGNVEIPANLVIVVPIVMTVDTIGIRIIVMLVHGGITLQQDSPVALTVVMMVIKFVIALKLNALIVVRKVIPCRIVMPKAGTKCPVPEIDGGRTVVVTVTGIKMEAPTKRSGLRVIGDIMGAPTGRSGFLDVQLAMIQVIVKIVLKGFLKSME